MRKFKDRDLVIWDAQCKSDRAVTKQAFKLGFSLPCTSPEVRRETLREYLRQVPQLVPVCGW